MAKSPNKAEGLWPFLDADAKIRSEAANVIHPETAQRLSGPWSGGWGGGPWSNGWSGPWGAPLRARPSGLKGHDGRPGVSLGWHPDVPDFRDRKSTDEKVAGWLGAAAKKMKRDYRDDLPARWAENLQWCSPVENQGDLGSCTAQAVVSLAEYMQRRAGIEHVDGSRLFVYKVTRNLLGWNGDTGAYLRTAMKAMAAFGVPPEEHWPYRIDRYEDEPTAFLYSYAQNYQLLQYTRIDVPGRDPKEVLEDIKRVLASGLCVVFGFSVYSSLNSGADIPFPTEQDQLSGGHAVMAVGYDDEHQLPDGTECPSLIIRNSWGTDWGAGGYGFLPYAYVERGLARDFWTTLKAEWIELEQFG